MSKVDAKLEKSLEEAEKLFNEGKLQKLETSFKKIIKDYGFEVFEKLIPMQKLVADMAKEKNMSPEEYKQQLAAPNVLSRK